jgi:predicted RNA-binding Zn ribbon-like protein
LVLVVRMNTMTGTTSRTGSLKLLGGRLSLDYCNTVDWRTSAQPEELLTSYDDLVAWGQHTDSLTREHARLLLTEALRRPRDARAVLSRAIRLREAVYGVFLAVAHGLYPDPADLAALNAKLSDMLARSKVVQTGAGFAWEWAGAEHALDRLLWPVVHDAADLLISGDLDRIRECAGTGCGWLFLDQSRNRSRRWCAMDDCGNRAKARRHYERKRGGDDG